MSGIPTLVSICALAVTLVSAIAGFAAMWGAMREKQKVQEDAVEKLTRRQDCTDAKAAEHDTGIARLEEGLKGVKEELKSVNAKLDRILDRQAAGRDV